jgi:hypothetical protein
MTYPKPFMTRNELIEHGLSGTLLDRAYHDPNQTFAMKITPTKKNSPIMFEVAEFDKWRIREIKKYR